MSSLEDLFGKLAMTTVNTVSRIAISHATNAAIRGVTTYIKQKPTDNSASRELTSLQRQFDLKIKNLKPTIDVIAHTVADGNQDLQPALEMCNDLQREIDKFANEMQDSKANNTDEYVRQRLRHLLNHIDDTVPSLYLALRNIPSKTSLSLSRLVQASAVLQSSPSQPFYLRLYSLFAASASGVLSWKEEYPKCQLVIGRADNEDHPFARKLLITEDFDDDRFHEEGEKPQTLTLDLENLKRMYYTRSGTLLNLEDSREAVLVLKILKKTPSSEDKDASHSPSSSPQIKAKEKNPKIERDELQEADWYALEIWKNGESNGEEEEDDEDQEEKKEGNEKNENENNNNTKTKNTTNGMEGKSLLLLESVIKLSLLESVERMNHLKASDDLIRLYMEE
ncbi:Ran-binding-domain-containing protein [Lichtheimia hyalospora FSU 10163]|nr:Ran-binding-domain-containing protein [Lichtheimia hyalospora FSU 10163]